MLDKFFPEFKPVFKSRFSVTALCILANYQSPERIASMNSQSYEPLRRLSRGRFTLSDFVKLKVLAKNTVGSTSDFLLYQMSILLELYSKLDSRLTSWSGRLRTASAISGRCLPLITNAAVFAEYYAKKRAEGKTHRIAMTHVAKKLLRVIYALQTKNIPFNFFSMVS